MALELLGAKSMVGIDWMQALKGAANALSGAGNLMSGGGGGGGGAAQAAALEQQRRIEEDRRRAEERSERIKLGLGIGAGALGLLLAAVILRRPS